MNAIIAYVPVIHQGYIQFFELFDRNSTQLFILGESITNSKRSFQKDIRATPSKMAAFLISSLDIFSGVFILDQVENKLLGSFDPDKFDQIYMPEDEMSREFSAQYLGGTEVEFINYFLRWDSNSAKAHKDVNCMEFEADDFLVHKLQLAIHEGSKTTDIYRNVGGILFNEEEVILVGHNSAYPDENLPFYEGDPRSLFKKGIHIDLSTALHAEARLISDAARLGICTYGLEMLVTDFPCPPCAKLIANSGIKTVYYQKGYAMLDGERVLREKGVEIYKIKTPS